MAEFMKSRSAKKGLPPGTPVHIGETRQAAPFISTIISAPDEFRETTTGIDGLPVVPAPPAICWINIEGIHHLDTLSKLSERFAIHPLVQEDILNTDQRPKLEDYDNYLYVVVKMLSPSSKPGDVIVEQVSLVVGERFLLSFQEGLKGDAFEALRDRLRLNRGHIRSMGTDYLAYCLLDSVVDGYFLLLENIADRISDLEDALVQRPSRQLLHSIHHIRREVAFIRRAVWPLRDMIGSLQRHESPLITSQTLIYLRDLHDHAIQVIETVELFRETLSGMLEIYLSGVSHRTNEVMRVLTVIATIFMPLTFIAGVYGMNFRYMPELEWHWGYFAVLGFMAGIAIFMLALFRKKRWL